MPSRVWRVAARMFTWIGVALVAYAAGTMAYGALSERRQSREFEHEVAAVTVADTVVTEEAADVHEGDVLGRLEVQRLGLSVMILQGVEQPTLVAGAGHVPGTPLPGGDGNVAIAGHRDTFFRKLEGIRAGDTIQVATVHHVYEYAVDSTEIVEPGETRVIESRGRSELTLITCYPFSFIGAAPRRFIVHARPLQ